MGFVIPGGAQGAQHSGGAAMAVLISTMLGRESGNPPHPAHGYLQDKGFPALSQNCTCPVHADQSFSKMQSEQSSSPSQYCSCCAVLVAGTRGQAVLGGPRAETPVCVVLEGWLNSLASTHHCSFTALCHRKTQDGNYSETSQRPHWQKPWISQSWGRAQWHSSVRGFEEK